MWSFNQTLNANGSLARYKSHLVGNDKLNPHILIELVRLSIYAKLVIFFHLRPFSLLIIFKYILAFLALVLTPFSLLVFCNC